MDDRSYALWCARHALSLCAEPDARCVEGLVIAEKALTHSQQAFDLINAHVVAQQAAFGAAWAFASHHVLPFRDTGDTSAEALAVAVSAADALFYATLEDVAVAAREAFISAREGVEWHAREAWRASGEEYGVLYDERVSRAREAFEQLACKVRAS